MKRATLWGLLIPLITLFTIAGCGQITNNNTPSTKTAQVKIYSEGTLSSGAQIGGIDITVLLPSGVTVAATHDGGKLVTNDGVVAASGGAVGDNTLTIATYTPASPSMPGTVVIKLVNPDGFDVGEFVTVNCDIAQGSSPRPNDFKLTGFTAINTNYGSSNTDTQKIPGLTVGLTVDMPL